MTRREWEFEVNYPVVGIVIIVLVFALMGVGIASLLSDETLTRTRVEVSEDCTVSEWDHDNKHYTQIDCEEGDE